MSGLALTAAIWACYTGMSRRGRHKDRIKIWRISALFSGFLCIGPAANLFAGPPDMSTAATSIPDVSDADTGHQHSPREGLSRLALGAIGVVFGDIGTSPLYSLKESFVGAHPLPVDRDHIFGVVSLIFWTLMMIVTVKYVLIVMRAHNRGEGGSLALLALISRTISGKAWTQGIVMLGVLATALFYGDAMITPAISVLSAVEGLTVVQASLASL